MKPELRQKIIAFNKLQDARQKKSDDLDALVEAIMKLPPGQLKKVLTDDVIAILAKYGVDFS